MGNVKDVKVRVSPESVPRLRRLASRMQVGLREAADAAIQEAMQHRHMPPELPVADELAWECSAMMPREMTDAPRRVDPLQRRNSDPDKDGTPGPEFFKVRMKDFLDA